MITRLLSRICWSQVEHCENMVERSIVKEKDALNKLDEDTRILSTRYGSSLSTTMAAWLIGNGVAHINEVTLRRRRLALGWVTVCGFNCRFGTSISVCDQPRRSTQPGHPFVGRRVPPFGSLRLPTKGWPGCVDMGGWSHTERDVPTVELSRHLAHYAYPQKDGQAALTWVAGHIPR